MEFREWLHLEMTTRGLDPSKLARASKVPQPTIFRILSGETKDPRIGTVKKLEAALSGRGSESAKANALVARARTTNAVVAEFEWTYNHANDEGRKFLQGALDAAKVFVQTKEAGRKKA